MYGRNSSVAFLSSDRFFGGSHRTFAKLAEFGAVWGSRCRDYLPPPPPYPYPYAYAYLYPYIYT
jgi:hypothetical protein